MEFLVFLGISGVCAAAMFFAAVNAARKPGEPQRGLFLIEEADGTDKPKRDQPPGNRRSGPWRPAR